MEFMLDTINIEQITRYCDCVNIAGVTSNPSIVKKTGAVPFFQHMKKIREIIGMDRSLHVQVIGTTYSEMLQDARKILANIDDQVFIKIPVTLDGLKVMKELKKETIHVTATAIYSTLQGMMALNVGVDYLAPYYNRMADMGIDSNHVIAELSKEIFSSGSKSKILAASFKNSAQMNEALWHGAHGVTVSPDIVTANLATPAVQKAVTDFAEDWKSLYGHTHI